MEKDLRIPISTITFSHPCCFHNYLQCLQDDAGTKKVPVIKIIFFRYTQIQRNKDEK